MCLLFNDKHRTGMVEVVSLISMCFMVFVAGPFLSRSVHSTAKFVVTPARLSTYGCLAAVLVDSAFYGTILYLSIWSTSNQTTFIDRRADDHHHLLTSRFTEEEQFLQPISEALELLARSQTDLYDLIEDFNKESTINQPLLQNTRSKLTTLRFLHNDSLTSITENITQRLQLLKSNPSSAILGEKPRSTVANPSLPSGAFLTDRVYYYIFTSSVLLFMQQLALWTFQYLSLRNPSTYLSCAFITSLIILSQSIGLVYFLQLTNTFYFPSPLYVYTCVFLIRSFLSIHHYCFYT